MEKFLQAKPMHHTQTRTQQTTTLASTCLRPHVTPVCSVLGNKSPSSPRTCCCQSTLCRGWFTHGDLVVDTLIQLFGTTEQNTAGQWFHPLQALSLSRQLSSSHTHSHSVGTEKAQVFPRPIRRLSAAVRGEDCSL